MMQLAPNSSTTPQTKISLIDKLRMQAEFKPLSFLTFLRMEVIVFDPP
jgi:hypothetical protein